MSRPTGRGRGPPLSEAERVLAARLRAAGCVFAEEEAALLRAAASGAALADLVTRRVAGEPLEHLLGWADFCGRRVAVSPGVFVPRRRTELLVDLTVGVVRDETVPTRRDPGRSRHRPPHLVVDLCCGSGAVGAGVAAALRERGTKVEVWAGDLDPVAVDCARRNLPPQRVVEGDLFDALPVRLRGSVDVVVVNAPYVPSGAVASLPREARAHEPRHALAGGEDGVDLHRRVAGAARAWLRPGGHLVLETSRSQAALTLAACAAGGLDARVHTDDERDATAVVAVAP